MSYIYIELPFLMFLITRPEESYRLCCVVVCDLETSRMGAPYIYDIYCLRVNTPILNIFCNFLSLVKFIFFVMSGVVTNIGHTLARGIFNGNRKMEFSYCRGRKRSCERQLTEVKQHRASRYLETWFVILTTANHKHIQAAVSRITAVSLPTYMMLTERYDFVLPLFLYLTLRLTPLHWIVFVPSLHLHLCHLCPSVV